MLIRRQVLRDCIFGRQIGTVAEAQINMGKLWGYFSFLKVWSIYSFDFILIYGIYMGALIWSHFLLMHFQNTYMENTWVRRSTLGMIWENYGDNLPIQIPCQFKLFWSCLDIDFIWELHFSFLKKRLIFDLIFIYGIFMAALIKVPQLVPVKTPLYLMLSSCTYNTR